MDGTHAAVGAGALTLSDALTNVLQHFQHVDAATATSEAVLLTFAVGALVHAVATWLNRRKAAPAVDPTPAPAAQ